MTEPFYQLEGVAFAIGGREILRPLTLDFAPGRIVALVGPNGACKSTLLKLLARQLRPSAGAIRCGGRDIAAWGGRAFARTVAFMPQFTPAADGMTVAELARLGRFPWHGPFGRFGAEDAAKVAAALADTGLEALSHRRVDTLSGGERQRAWLAMLLAQDPRCLLLDEPTSALDLAHQVEVLRLVRDLGRGRGIGAVVVLHDVNLAARFCDEIVAMRGGRVVARGAPAALMTPATLSAIYGIAIGVVPHPETGAPIAHVEGVA